MGRRLVCGALTWALLFGGGLRAPARPEPAPVRISGLTQEWKGKDTYDALPNVEVTVLRNGSVVSGTKSQLNQKREAEYGLEVRGGEPIQVVFYLSKNYVPEMQSLSARPGLEHRVSAALMTVKQYRDMQKASPAVVPLNEKLRCLGRVVPRDHPLYRQIEQMLRGLD